jgi:hypothetical protein
MGIQTIAGGGFLLPQTMALRELNTMATTQSILDNTDDRVAFIFRVPKTGNITKVGFHVITAATPQTIRVSLCTVDATTGDPNTALYGGSAAGTQASPAANTFYEVTLGTAASATIGDTIAVVLQFDTTAGDVGIRPGLTSVLGRAGVAFPYMDAYVTAWTKGAANGVNCIPMCTIGYDDGTYPYNGMTPGASTVPAAVTFNNTSTPDEVGNRFTVPFLCRVSGFWAIADFDGDADLVLYDSASTALATVSVDKDIEAVATAAYQTYLPFAPVTLRPNVVYRAVVKPTSATNLIIYRLTTQSAAMMDQMSGGQAWYETSRTDAGSWTDTTTQRILALGLFFDGFHDGVHPSYQMGL